MRISYAIFLAWLNLGLLCSAQEASQWSFEGELRQQAVYQNVLDFGVESREQLSQLLSRLRLKLDYHPGPGWDLRLGASNSLAWGTLKPGPNDQDSLYLEEAYLGLPLGPRDSKLWLGRQLLSLGTGRLVSARLGPNIPLSFDGARYRLDLESIDLDLFALSPVRNQDKLFSDPSGQDVLWGAYATHAYSENHQVDLYLLGTNRQNLFLNSERNLDTRLSLGTRFSGSRGVWDYNIEAVYQTGSFGERPISAWTVATDNSWGLSQEGWRPRLGFKGDIASGSSNSQTMGTFHPLYPNFSYFSEAALISPSNLVDFNPYLTLQPTEAQTLTLGWDFLWRHSRNDGLYTPPGVELLPAGAGDSRRVGDQVSLLYQNQLSEAVEFEVGFTHFRSGPFLREAGGESTTFVATSWTLNF